MDRPLTRAHNYQSYLFTEWILMSAPLWRRCTGASLTVEYPSVWWTGRSHAVLMRSNFEMFSPDSLPVVIGSLPASPASWLLIYSSDSHRKRLILKVALYSVCSVPVSSASRLTVAFWGLCVCVCVCVCVKSDTVGGVCVNRRTQHQQVVIITDTLFSMES